MLNALRQKKSPATRVLIAHANYMAPILFRNPVFWACIAFFEDKELVSYIDYVRRSHIHFSDAGWFECIEIFDATTKSSHQWFLHLFHLIHQSHNNQSYNMGRGKAWFSEADFQLAQAWVQASQDPIIGTNQDGKSFGKWSKATSWSSPRRTKSAASLLFNLGGRISTRKQPSLTARTFKTKGCLVRASTSRNTSRRPSSSTNRKWARTFLSCPFGTTWKISQNWQWIKWKGRRPPRKLMLKRSLWQQPQAVEVMAVETSSTFAL